MALKFERLTRDGVKRLSRGAKLTEHGISAQRNPKGDIVYSINIMVDGARIHRTIGRESEGVTRTDAERQIEQYRTDARSSRLNLPKGRKSFEPFSEAAKDYIERLERSGGKDLVNKRRHINTRLIPEFGKTPINRITTHAISTYAEQRSNVSPLATVNRELSTLSHMLNCFVDWQWIAPTDKPKISKTTEPRKPITVLTDTDSLALINAARQDVDSRLHLFVAFGLNTAMRHSEILKVRYDQIDFENRRIHIPKAKAGQRDQPIPNALATLLWQQREKEIDPSGWVFPAAERCKYPHRVSMDKGFRRAVIKAGLDPLSVTPHVMRHTAITRLVKAGIDLPTIQRISGHKTPTMVLRYTHIYGEHLDRAIEKIANVPG